MFFLCLVLGKHHVLKWLVLPLSAKKVHTLGEFEWKLAPDGNIGHTYFQYSSGVGLICVCTTGTEDILNALGVHPQEVACPTPHRILLEYLCRTGK